MIHIDHGMFATNNIEETTQRFREQYGLNCFKGGLHPDGTRTWVVPLGSKYVQYIEILTVENPEQASKDFYGRWLLEKIKGGEAFIGWALQTDEIDEICARHDLKPWTGSVTRPEGSSSSWSEAGFEQVATSGWLPFFISYNDLDARRTRSQADLVRVQHNIEPIEISWIEVGGKQEQLREWLGDRILSELPVRVSGTTPGMRAIGVKTTKGEVIIR
jgi:hypothetical protein